MPNNRHPGQFQWRRWLLPLGALVAGLFVRQPHMALAALGAWSTTDSMSTAREFHTETLLLNGQVLVTGGVSNSPGVLASAELYNPTTGHWALTAPMLAARYDHTATRLNDGTVLVAGGSTPTESGTASAELYNPATGTWATTGSMITGRITHTATLLPDGKVLVVGGQAPDVLASAELYNPTTGTWATTTSSMSTARYLHTATVLPNGKVLVAGGGNFPSPSSPIVILNSAELYDPAAGTWTTTASLATARGNHGATLLANGKVLVSGGISAPFTELSSAELYDPIAGTWATTGSLNNARGFHGEALLANGKVLVAGGLNGTNVLNSAELYDPAAGTWAATGSLNTARDAHNGAMLLSGGKVFVAGGQGNSGKLASAELFVYDATPPTLSLPTTVTAEATGPTGAAVTYTATASDPDDGAVTPTCTPASGSTFALGTTTVNCTAMDPAGNSTTGSFTVTVVDTTPPVVTVPSTITVPATSPSGAVVTFSASATDLADGAITPTCTPASGATFAIGSTTVTCTATDAHGNPASKTFTVTVTNASQQLSALLTKVQALPLDPATRNNLISILQAAQASLSKGDTAGACDKLTSFISQVQAQSGKKIAKATADDLIADAQRIKKVLGCP